MPTCKLNKQEENILLHRYMQPNESTRVCMGLKYDHQFTIKKPFDKNLLDTHYPVLLLGGMLVPSSWYSLLQKVWWRETMYKQL